MNNAKKLFEQIKSLDYIKHNMIGKQMENTWLDFKQKARPERGEIDDADKKNFAKSLSGFGNTSGGVLIFGVDARKDIEGIDIPQKIVPISGVYLFESELREQETRIIERAIPGLQYKVFETKYDEGVIVIYIPTGPNPPYRSLKDHRFYIRAGDSFSSVDLPQIESLLMKSMKPNLYLDMFMSMERKGENTYLFIDFQMRNVGNTLAKYVFLQMRFPDGTQNIFQVHNRQSSAYSRWEDPVTHEVIYDWIYEYVIHTNRTIRPKSPLKLLLTGAADPPPLNFEAHLWAENMPEKMFVVEMSEEDVASAVYEEDLYKLQVNKDFFRKI